MFFLDLSRGAEYEKTIVTESIIREWAWALFVFDDSAEFESDEARKDRHHSNYRTIRKQSKTFKQLCRYYGNCEKAGGEFFGDYGKRIPRHTSTVARRSLFIYGWTRRSFWH